MRMTPINMLAGAVLALGVAEVMADSFTIAGVTFDTVNSAQTAHIVEGSASTQDYSSKIFARVEQSRDVLVGDATNPFVTFDRGKSVGRLLGRSAKHTDDRARYVSMPEKGTFGPQPNKDRLTIELTWGKHGIKNEQGPDFVVYEVGSYEAFAVAVRKVGSTEWSHYRYQFAFQSDPAHGVNSVTFDLTSFGVAPGEVVDAIRIRNVFNSESAQGADKVDQPIGEGRVLYPGDIEYITGHKLLSSVRGDEFRTDSLDADIIYVASLHKVVPTGKAEATGTGTGSAN